MSRRFQSILFVAHGESDESNALSQAFGEARNHGASMEVLIAFPALPRAYRFYERSFQKAIVSRVEESIEKARAMSGIGEDEVRSAVNVETGPAPDVIVIKAILRKPHDLLMKEMFRPREVGGVAALDKRLLRRCPVPVWLCRNGKPSGTHSQIAVAVSPPDKDWTAGDLSLQLLQLGDSLADGRNGTLHIVSCWDYEFEETLRRSPWLRVEEVSIATAVEEAKRHHQTMIERLMSEAGIATTSAIHLRRGRPDAVIPPLLVELGADLLVVGSLGRRGLPGFVVGNTAENLGSKVSCSLLVAKPNGFRSPVQAYG